MVNNGQQFEEPKFNNPELLQPKELDLYFNLGRQSQDLNLDTEE